MECTFEEVGDVLKIGLDGRFVAANADEVRERVTKRIGNAKKVVFDLSKMAHIDSSGLGVLVQFQKRANAEGIAVRLAGLLPHPRLVFDITKVYRVFEISETVDLALASLAGKA